MPYILVRRNILHCIFIVFCNGIYHHLANVFCQHERYLLELNVTYGNFQQTYFFVVLLSQGYCRVSYKLKQVIFFFKKKEEKRHKLIHSSGLLPHPALAPPNNDTREGAPQEIGVNRLPQNHDVDRHKHQFRQY